MDFGKGYLTTLKFYFVHYEQFLNFMEGYIQQTIDSFDKENPIDEKLAIENPDYYYFLVDDISERWWQYSRDFPSEFRTTFLSQLYSGVDAHLNRICSKFHIVHLPPKDVKAMKGSEWSQKAKYLTKFAAVDFSILKDEWDFLDHVRQIRNLIIHHHSSISSADRDWHSVKKFISHNPDLIIFKDDIEEKDEHGVLLYKSYPNHRFEFLIHSPKLNQLLLKKSQDFFKKLIPQISFK